MPAAILASVPRKVVSGTTYTVLAGDAGKLLLFTHASGCAVDLPVFADGWAAWFKSENDGTVVTPASTTIDGAATLALDAGQSRLVESDGADYETTAAGGGSASAFTDLTDTPSTYTGSGGYALTVTISEDGVEFTELGSAAFADTGDFATATQGALADSAVQPGDLATVAFSGAYSDLSGLPTLVTTFLGLTDTPSSYSGQGGKLVAVNSGATALEFVAPAETPGPTKALMFERFF